MAPNENSRNVPIISELEILTKFRERILETKGGANCLVDDEFLLPFLRSRKYNIDEATTMVKRFFNAKKATFSNLTVIPSLMTEVLEEHHICKLRALDEEGRGIFWSRPGIWDTSRFTFEEFAGSLFLVVNEALKTSRESQELGNASILDLHGFGLSHMRQFWPSRVRNIEQFLHGSFPVRVKQIHLVRTPLIYKVFWKVCKPFLSEKIRSRFFIHGNNMESLHKWLDPSILPEELGGSLTFAQAVDQELLKSLLIDDNYYRKLDAAGFE